MQIERIPLYADRTDVYLDAYISDQLERYPDFKRRAMLVIPGGGYNCCSDREAEPVAKAFMARGMNAFVLYYSVKEQAKFPQPMQDASLAMHIIRSRAEEFHIDPQQITVCGFSAGGHLAASMATTWTREEYYRPLGLSYGENMPNAAILCYPVISGGPNAHQETIQTLAGTKTPTAEIIKQYSLENHVNETACPAFIWHTANDTVVPVENSLLLASAYAKANRPFELHIFPNGPHGLSLATPETSLPGSTLTNPHCAVWVDLACRWLDTIYQI